MVRNQGGAVIMRGFASESELLAHAQTSGPSVAQRPAVLVPYIRAQLLAHKLLDETDLHGEFHDPHTQDDRTVGRLTPELFTYNPESRGTTIWHPSEERAPLLSAMIIPEHIKDTPPTNSPSHALLSVYRS
jgi:hypothetical protein